MYSKKNGLSHKSMSCKKRTSSLHLLFSKNYLAVCLTALAIPAVPAMAKGSTDTMVVTANRFSQPLSSVLAPMDVVTRDDLDRWQVNSLGEALSRLPGVDIMQYGGRGQTASIFIRGTDTSQVLVLIDGIRMASPGVTGSIDFNQIPLALVQRIEFIRGPQSTVYGSEAIGGVINIITERVEDGGGVNVGFGSNRYQNYNGGGSYTLGDKTKVSLAGGYESTRGFNVYPDSPAANGVDDDDDGFRSKSLWLGVEHQFTDGLSGLFRGYGYDNNSEYDQASKWGGSDERLLRSRNYDLGLRYQYGEFSSQLITSYQKYRDHNYESSEGPYSDGSTLDDITQRSIVWGNTYRLYNGMISAGADWREERTKPGTAYVTEGKSRDNTGIYATVQQRYGDVTLEGGARFDDNEQFGHHETWQTAAAWEFIPAHRLGLSYGTAFRAPTLGQLYGYYGVEDLSPESSKQWELSLDATSGPVQWRVAGYRNSIDNQIGYDSSRKKYYNNAHVLIKGVELTGEVETGPLQHRVTLEYLDPKDRDTDKLLARRARKKARYQLDWQVYKVDMNIAYQYNGRRYNDRANKVVLSPYSTVDIAASYPLTTNLTIRGRIANLFDENYETAQGYATAGREYYVTGSYSF